MKILFKCRVGSHLYGTNKADSDEDFAGVFIPSVEQLCSINGFNHEVVENIKLSNTQSNQAGDIDCKFFSLQKFLKLALQGQPGQLEMLFAPKQAILIKDPLWDLIVNEREKFLSQRSLNPFLNFALSQVKKATLKGEHFKEIEKLLSWGEDLTQEELNLSLDKHYEIVEFGEVASEVVFTHYSKQIALELGYSKTGSMQVQVAGRHFDLHIKTKQFLTKLKQIKEKYGARTKRAAQLGFDFKSLGHAARLIDEAEELVFSKKITLPRPNSSELLKIFNAEVNAEEILISLDNKISELKTMVETSSLLKEPNWKEAEAICTYLISSQFQE